MTARKSSASHDRSDEDLLPDLPPQVDGDDDEPSDEAEPLDVDEVDDGLDDSTLDDADFADPLPDEEEEGLGDDDVVSTGALDEDLDLAESDESALDDRESDPEEDESLAALDAESGLDDGGEEGPVNEESFFPLEEAALEPDEDDARSGEGGEELAAFQERVQFTWKDAAWRRLSLDRTCGPLRCVARGPVGAFAVGAQLFRVESTGPVRVGAKGLPPSVDALGLAGERLAVAAAGVVYLADVGDWEFKADKALRASPLGLVGSDEIMAVLAPSGVLLGLPDSGAPRVFGEGVDRVAADPGAGGFGIYVRARNAIEWLGAQRHEVTAPFGGLSRLALYGESIAVMGEGIGVAVGRGDAWDLISGTLNVTALAFATADVLLMALYSSADDRTWLLEARGADVNIVAELGDDDWAETPIVTDLVWDPVGDCAYLVGPFGFAAFARP